VTVFHLVGAMGVAVTGAFAPALVAAPVFLITRLVLRWREGR